MSDLNPTEIYNEFAEYDLVELQTKYFSIDHTIKDLKTKHEKNIMKLEMMKSCLYVLIDKKIEEVFNEK
jgi:hypothetical protein